MQSETKCFMVKMPKEKQNFCVWKLGIAFQNAFVLQKGRKKGPKMGAIKKKNPIIK